MNDDFTYIGFFLLVCLGFIIKIAWDEKQRKIRNEIKARDSWGSRPTREYLHEEFESITHYFRRHSKGKFVIDDITWNDLDMDTIYMLVNQTNSSIGDECLYNIMRTPCFDQKVLEERNRIIQYFQENEEERLKLQMVFKDIGRSNRISISDYIYSLHDLEITSSLPHILMALSIPVSIIFLIMEPAVGVLVLVAAIANNIIQYYRKKHKIEVYIDSVKYIIRILNGAAKLEKVNIPAIKEYQEQIHKSRVKFNKMKTNAFFVTSANATGGGLLEIVMEYVRLFFHLDFIKFNSMVRELKIRIGEIESLFDNMGALESGLAIASFRALIPYYTLPILEEGSKAFMHAENLYHPMIENPVANSIHVEKGVLVTGSNASGKSTFLKVAAINAILSQTIYTSLADYYKANFFKIYSSMALQDDLMSQESYYIVEIKSLKRILDGVQDSGCILCFVDEVLRGTNTVERIAASSQILKSLAKDNVLCFAATHDIELTHILEKYYNNYHFEEKIENNDIFFNYRLFEGRATSRNAIKLLSIIGYSDDIIKKAEETAERFTQTGDWQL